MKNLKKLVSLILAVLLAGSLAACGGNNSAASDTAAVTDNPTMIANPMTEVDSIEALNTATGAKIARPDNAGLTEESYFLIKTSAYDIAEYRFTIDGINYTLRFAKGTTDDISGIYVEDGTLFQYTDAGYADTTEYKGVRKFDDDGQYILVANDFELLDADTVYFLFDEVTSVETQLDDNID